METGRGVASCRVGIVAEVVDKADKARMRSGSLGTRGLHSPRGGL